MPADAPSFRAAVARLATEWDVGCDDAQGAALERFCSLLLTWNERINLTGATSLEALAGEHLPDSFALASRFAPEATDHIVDVGSGGGLPALPLALLRPHLKVRLVEPIAKKAAFLRTATRELGLRERVVVNVGRAEALDPGAFDAALSRATFAPAVWAPLGVPLVRPAGRVYVLAATPGAAFAPPPSSSLTFQRPYLEGRRTLVELTRST